MKLKNPKSLVPCGFHTVELRGLDPLISIVHLNIAVPGVSVNYL
jgi:hypothetical protein